jgi:ATP adenylyltransferase
MINECPFCDRETMLSREDYGRITAFAIRDNYPVSDGHYLIIPHRHVSNFFDLTGAERHEVFLLIQDIQSDLRRRDRTITGFNIGINIGESAGQTVMHCHVHLIPRRDGDTPNPRGGVRGVIPDKMSY